MKKSLHLVTLLLIGMGLCMTSCKKKSKGVWDDSGAVSSVENRSLWENQEGFDDGFNGPKNDFVALQNEDLKAQFVDNAVPQPAFMPGEHGSGMPGHSRFYKASDRLASVFQNLYFNTDEYVLRSSESLASIDTVASYLRQHPRTAVYVEGFCDERGAEGYNLSLGSKRANYVRSLLVQKGVEPNQLHTISYGKEQPVDTRHTPEAWSKNRRAEFKIYEQ